MFKSYSIDNNFLGRFNKGDDLFKSLSLFLENNNIKSGVISGIGALQKASIGFYNQKEFKYKTININKPVEVVSFIGNISLKEGHPFPHCHIVVADENGETKGGHLLEGCIVFAFEFSIVSFDGAALVRGFDNETKLPLWKFID